MLQADSEQLMNIWMNALQNSISIAIQFDKLDISQNKGLTTISARNLKKM